MFTPPVKLPVGLRPFGYPLLFRRLTEGFFHAPLEENPDAYRFTAVSGVERLPAILEGFGRLLPTEAFFILEHYTEDVNSIDWSQEQPPIPSISYSPYLPTDVLLDALRPYWPRLIHDGFVGFGLANSREGLELFFSEEKVLTFFTGNYLQISDMLQRQGLPYNPKLSLPTDFEHEHLALMNIGRRQLPAALANMPLHELDYRHFCGELGESLDMYPVEEGPSFFLTKKEQDQIETFLRQNEDAEPFWEEEFGNLLLDWVDFVEECLKGFDGDLWEYRQALALRDLIEQVAAGVSPSLSAKLLEVIREADERFRELLTDRHKRFDARKELPERFWYHGIIRNPGSELRRDLIREGWYHR